MIRDRRRLGSIAPLGGFTPAALSSLIRWGDPIRQGASGAVVTSTDYSGAGNDFTASGTLTWNSTGLNGKPCISIAGAGELRRNALAASFSAAVPWSIGSIGKITGVMTNPYYLITLADATGSLPTHDVYYRAASRTWWSDRRNDAGTEVSMGGGTPDQSVHVVIYTFDGSAGRIYIDGTLVSTFTQGSGALTPTECTLWGHKRGALDDGQWSGLVGDDVISLACWTQTQVTQLTNYLATKYSATLTAPADEPGQIFTTALGAWYAQDSLNGTLATADGATPSTWLAKNTVTDLTVSGAPTLRRGYHNAKDWIRIGGNRYTIPAATAALASGTGVAFTTGGTFRWYDTSINHTLFSLSDGGAAGSFIRLYVDTTGHLVAEQRNNAGTTTTATSASALDGGPHNYEWSYSGSAVTVWIDGVKWIDGGALSGGACTLSTGAVGALLRAAASETWYDELGAFVLATGASTTAQIARLDAYLRVQSPIQTANSLVLDISADAGTYSDAYFATAVTADASNILSWLDSVSGNGFQTSDKSATYKAVLHTGGPNSKRYATFANTALLARLLANVLRSNNPFTMTLVIRETAAETGLAVSYATSTIDIDYGYIRARYSGISNKPMFLRSNDSLGALGNADPGAGWTILTIRSNGTYVKVSTNAGTEITTNPTGTPATTLDIVTLGSLVRASNPNGVFYSAADLAAIRVRNYDDSAFTDRDALNVTYAVY